MIVAKLQGGLGNQMFQYAAAKSLAFKYKSQLLIDVSFLEETVAQTIFGFTKRGYELGIFENIEQRFLSREQLKHFTQISAKKKWLKILGLASPKIYNELRYEFNESFFLQKPPVLLDGYWQSEKYFKIIQDHLRKDFSFTKEPNTKTKYFANLIKNAQTSVSLHVRRGDYVTSPSTNSFHGLQGVDYYEKAIKLLQDKTTNPVCFVFSDDTAWVKEHLVKDDNNMHVVEHNQNNDSWQDMYLMSLCNHQIIANSSFSWWGAWLNEKEDKIVIAPKKWFANEEKNEQVKDLIPPTWIRL